MKDHALLVLAGVDRLVRLIDRKAPAVIIERERQMAVMRLLAMPRDPEVEREAAESLRDFDPGWPPRRAGG